jgi:tRNA-specific 2-thiouridylase
VLVTGHHARTREEDGEWRLLRGRDAAKDQSYVLSMLTQRELSRVRFPVGELTKGGVRRLAEQMSMRTAYKAESMDICFVGERDYRGFLREMAPGVFEAGNVVDSEGHQVGTHDGIAGFTVGQRRGLGVAVGEPRYVIRIDAETSTIVVGPREALAVGSVGLDQLTWTAGVGADGPVMAQYRAHSAPVSAWLSESTTLVFDEPQEAVAPGQTVAFYHDEVVLGGALITSTS